MTTPDDAAPRGRPDVRAATRLIREFLDASDDFEAHVGRELTVNPTDLQAMQHLIMGGPQSPTDLARKLGLTTAATTAVVDRLVAVGHVSRTQHPTDRRGVVVVPSPGSVVRAMDTLMPMIMGIDGVLDEFDDHEQAIITEYLRRILEVYRSHIPDAD